MKSKFLFFAFLSLQLHIICFAQVAQQNADKSQKKTLTIKAIDLSEDMSLMSSKNDELLFLIYKAPVVGPLLDSPAFVKSFVLDTANRTKAFDINIDKDENYFLFLIEMDDDRTTEQIDPVIRIYNRPVITIYQKQLYEDLYKYLGDNDLVGFLDLKGSDSGKEYRIQGRQNLDPFNYLIQIR
jgi:hypothetical protein